MSSLLVFINKEKKVAFEKITNRLIHDPIYDRKKDFIDKLKVGDLLILSETENNANNLYIVVKLPIDQKKLDQKKFTLYDVKHKVNTNKHRVTMIINCIMPRPRA